MNDRKYCITVQLYILYNKSPSHLNDQLLVFRLDGIAFTGAEITPDYDSLLGTLSIYLLRK